MVLASPWHVKYGFKLLDQSSTETFGRIFYSFLLLLLLLIDRWIDDLHVVLFQVLPQPLPLLYKTLKIGIFPGLFSEPSLEPESL